MTSPLPSGARPTDGEIIVHVFGRTDVGRTREHNEDAFVVADLTTGEASLLPDVRTHVLGPRGSLFMVADGLGGAAAGEIASELAVEAVMDELRQRWTTATDETPESFAYALKCAAEMANARIFEYAATHPEHRGLGTTATIAGLLHDTLYLAQVGDSRGYLVRGGVARQITKDQSLMQRLIEAGELTEEEALRSERRNIILQALGPEAVVKIDLTSQQVRRGDTLVLCTDGLSGLVRNDEIADVVASQDDLVEVCRELINRANENGGPDNITVVTARFDGSGLLDPSEDDRVGHLVFPLSATPPAAAPPRVEEQVTQPLTITAERERPKAPAGVPRARERGNRTMILAVTLALLAVALVAARHLVRRDPAPSIPVATDSAAGSPAPHQQ